MASMMAELTPARFSSSMFYPHFRKICLVFVESLARVYVGVVEEALAKFPSARAQDALDDVFSGVDLQPKDTCL